MCDKFSILTIICTVHNHDKHSYYIKENKTKFCQKYCDFQAAWSCWWVQHNLRSALSWDVGMNKNLKNCFWFFLILRWILPVRRLSLSNRFTENSILSLFHFYKGFISDFMFVFIVPCYFILCFLRIYYFGHLGLSREVNK